MKDNDYFSTLLSLYEAVSAEDAQRQQANIADTGSDVEDPNVDPNAQNAQDAAQQEWDQQEQPAEEQDPEGLDDASYISSTSEGAAPANPSDNSRKLARLFDLMQSLKLYAETLMDTLDSVELGLLDDSAMHAVENYRIALSDLSIKIKDYLNDVFVGDSYEKALYAYVMFRTELLVVLKQLRRLLKLNEVDEDKKK